jgi:hypothetical protein
MTVRVPVNMCTVPEIAAAMARRGYVIAGIEYLPGDCNVERAKIDPSEERIDLAGSTVEAALNRLIELDGRYQWIDSDGVIVVRPVEASGDPQNWLHSIATEFDLDNLTIGDALFKIASAVTGDPRVPSSFDSRTEQGARKLAVHLTGVSLVDTLNAIVRAHGAAWWEARDRARVAANQEDRMLWVFTHDGAGLGVTTKRYPLPQ